MIAFAFLVLALIAANADPISPRKNFPNGRIIGGENAVIETYPYQVSLEEFERHACGASIISANWIVTAGHCAVLEAQYIRIRSGTSISGEGGIIHQVEEVIRHEDYYVDYNGIPHNDIAVLRVKEPFHFDDKHQPIELYNYKEETKVGVSAVITGWGETNEWGYDGQLQTVSIPIISKELCDEAYNGLPEGQICAAFYGVGGKDACQGDSGGPLAINGRLAGIVSWGSGCAEPDYPGVYTEVAYFRDWIKKHVQF